MPSLEGYNAHYLAHPARAVVPTTPQEHAKQMRSALEGRIVAGEHFLRAHGVPGVRRAIEFWFEPGSEGLPVHVFGPGPGVREARIPGSDDPKLIVRALSRRDVCRELAKQLRALALEDAASKDDESLTTAILRRIPLHDSGHATDRTGQHDDDAFASDPERTVVAAFKAVGFPPAKADNLFNGETVAHARRGKKGRLPSPARVPMTAR